MNTYIPTNEVIEKFGYLIKGNGAVSGLYFAKTIIKSGCDCDSFRENCASTAASDIYEIEVFKERGYKVTEYIK